MIVGREDAASYGPKSPLVPVEARRKAWVQKSDVSDCQWIQYLHSVGLLRASFRPTMDICAVRSLWRHRGSLLQMASEHILHMQKSLSQMNLQIHHVLSDITGASGQAILEAILAGERNPCTLAALRDLRIKASADTITSSARSRWPSVIASSSNISGNWGIGAKGPTCRKRCGRIDCRRGREISRSSTCASSCFA